MMEKGSFHQTQNQTQPPTPDELVQRVPLPNQLPKGMDFSELPLSGLKSSALESLIGQNEDLMARLSVSLRRGSESEDRITEIEKQNSSLHSRFAAIKEQYSILQEKDRISAARFLEVHAESVEYRKQASKLEKLYADLYIQAQAFQKRLVRSERHCARLKKVARHLQSRARNADQYRLELDHSAAAQHQAVQTFEAKLKGVRFEIESMHTKVQERDRIFEERLNLENELVFERRQRERRENEMHAQIATFDSENSSLRVQLKDVLVLGETQRHQIDDLSAELPQLRSQGEHSREQVESLQALWSHKQKELEAQEEKNRSLQKLNQSLSLTLNQQRREIHTLEQEVEKERFEAHEKIKVMLSEIQMLRAKL